MNNCKRHGMRILLVLTAALMPASAYAVESAGSGSHVKYIIYAGIFIAFLIDLYYEFGGGKKKLKERHEARMKKYGNAPAAKKGSKPGHKGQPHYQAKKSGKESSGKARSAASGKDVKHLGKK